MRRSGLVVIGLFFACGGSTTSPSPAPEEPVAGEISDAASPGDETGEATSLKGNGGLVEVGSALC